ncbi:hypothetical protein ABH892_004152 [Paenibacillus sp. RC254]
MRKKIPLLLLLISLVSIWNIGHLETYYKDTSGISVFYHGAGG